jgi:hypothetical protein
VTIEFGPEVRGSRRILLNLKMDGEPSTYSIPKGRYVIVNEGDYVRVGDPIMDGPTNPHEILRVLGEKEVARYIVDEIQEVYTVFKVLRSMINTSKLLFLRCLRKLKLLRLETQCL